MNIVLLSGGSGKRLWPLSNGVRSKQFIKIFRNPGNADGYESMVQRVYRQIKAADPDAAVTVATGKSQVSAIRNQLGEGVGISVEPCRRDTFPAMALAAAYLREVQGVGGDEAVVVCPVDPYADGGYFRAIRKLGDLAQAGRAKLILLGIHPTCPSEKYGYIIPAEPAEISKVSIFREKPDAAQARQYIRQGGLWNGGVFACKLSYILDRAHERIDFNGYADLFARYDTLEEISFDCAVAEQETDIAVMRFDGEWKDLGTWNTLTEAMEKRVVGDVRLNEACENVHAINALDIPILAMGLRNAVIAASPEGILVSDKEQSSYIKPFVDAIGRQVMFAEKSWGEYRVLDVERESLTVKVTLHPGRRMNYHSHERRDEVWTVVSGSGRAIVDGAERPVRAGDVVALAAGCKHTVIAETELQLIEVQLGREISIRDKRKYGPEPQ